MVNLLLHKRVIINTAIKGNNKSVVAVLLPKPKSSAEGRKEGPLTRNFTSFSPKIK